MRMDFFLGNFMKSKSIVDALPIFAKLLADQCQVKLILNSPHTKTEDGEIHLPTLPLESKTLGHLAYGYIVREASRIRNKCDVVLDNTFFKDALLQRINDVWIELRAQQQYPGARKTLADLLSVLVDEGIFQTLTNMSSTAFVFMEFVSLYLRTKILMQVQLNRQVVAASMYLDSVLDPHMMNQVRAKLDRVLYSKSLESNVHIALELVELIRSYAKTSEMETKVDSKVDETEDGYIEPCSKNSDSTDDRDDGDSNSDIEGKQSSLMSECLSSDKESGDGEIPDSPSGDSRNKLESVDSNLQSISIAAEHDQNETCDSSGLNNQRAFESNETSEMKCTREKKPSQLHLQNILDERYDDASNSERIASLIDKQNLNSHKTVLRVANEVKPRAVDSGNYLLNTTRKTTGALRARLEILLESQARRKRYFAKRGEIVPKRVWRVKSGNMRVFECLDEQRAVNTSVLFCVDCSSSMGEPLAQALANDRDYDSKIPRINLAVQSVLSMSMALDGMRHVNSAAISFPCYDPVTKANNSISVLTDFDELAVRTADHYASLMADGNTPLAEAVMWSTYKLLSEKTERRILFIITDGEPTNRDAALQVLKFACDADIEVMGLGIGLDIHGVIPESKKILDLNQMPKMVFDMLSRKLENLAA